MKVVISFVLSMMLTSCTYSINFAHSEGSASINDSDTAQPDMSPSFTLPSSPLRV